MESQFFRFRSPIQSCSGQYYGNTAQNKGVQYNPQNGTICL